MHFKKENGFDINKIISISVKTLFSFILLEKRERESFFFNLLRNCDAR